MHKYATRILGILLLLFCLQNADAQGNKLSIQGTSPKNMSVCGLSDTARVKVFNISSSTVSSVLVTLSLPTGILYVPGSLSGTGVSESNITNLNKPVFSAGSLLIAKNFTFRYRIRANCSHIPLISGSSTPSIGIRADYTGNYDDALSLPFTTAMPAPGYNSITNQSYTGNVGDKFVRRITITNYGKGPLTSLRLVRIKGKDLGLRSETGFSHRYNLDSVITSIAKSDILKVGNKDTFLDQNESIALSDTFTINGCAFLTTNYDLAWGCDGKWCQVTKNNALVSISSLSPNLQVVITNSMQPVYNGTQVSKFTMRIANIGQMKANKVEAFIFQTLNPGAGFHNYELSRIDSTSIRVKKGWNGASNRVYTDTFLSNTATPCWPAGSMGGFRYKPQDMLPKDTLFITWDVYRCANTACNAAFYESGWGYRVNYTNQCKTVLSTNNQWGFVYTYSGGAVIPYTPTDLQQNETKPFRYTFSGMGNLPLHSSAAIRIDLLLPATLTHSLLTADFYIDNPNLTAVWNPDSIKLIKDTLRAYMGRTMKFGLTNAELTVRLKGICNGSGSNQNLPLSLTFAYNPNTTAHPGLWIKPVCNTVIAKVHCSNTCSKGGMLFRNFELFRSNYGTPDNDNDGLADASGSIDKLKIRSERIMFGDTLTTIFRGRPRNASGITNWRYGYAESFVTNGDYMTVVDAKLEVFKGATKISGNCNSVRWKKVSSGANATFYFDYTLDSIWRGGCLTSTYRFTQNDSVNLIVRYRVNKNRGQTTQPMTFSNRFYLATAANPTLSQSYQCDTFSGSCILYGYVFHNWGTDYINYANCAEVGISQNFYLGIGNCCNYGGGNIFPFEYRNWGRPVAMRLYLPTGMKLGQTVFIQYRTAGTNNTVTERKDTIPIRKGSSNPLIFDFVKYYKDSGGKVNYSDDGFHGTFWYSVLPSCQLTPNFTFPIQYDFIYEKRGALGKGFDTVSSQTMRSPDFFTFQPPAFTLAPALPIVYATKDTVEWEVRYSNPSSTFNASNIWLSPGKNSNIRVVQIRDAVKDTLIKPVNDIYRAGALPPNQTRRFKVRAVFSNCTPDSLLIFGGWNCQGYPADFTSNTCTPLSAKLYLEPQNTRLYVTLVDSVSKLDLCYSNRMTLTIENIQAVTAYQPKVRITLPIGMTLISGNSNIRYPHKTTAVKLANPLLQTGTTYEWDLSKLITGLAAGLPGTADTSKNKVVITFRVRTDCDYASGSFISARVPANIKCGDPVPGNTAYTNPLEINGIVRPYYTQVKNWSDSILPCEKPAYSKIRVKILGPSNTGENELVEILLPPGIKRDVSYFKAVINAPNKDSVTETNFNGLTLVSWKIPKNLQPGDSLEFDVRLLSEGKLLTCGPADLIVRSVIAQSVECVPDNKICKIKAITGSAIGTPTVDKGNLQFIAAAVNTRLINSDTEQVVLTYKIKNIGKYTSSATPMVIRYHFDADANGKWSAADLKLGTDTIRKTLKKDSILSFSRTLKIKAGQGCALIAVVDSGACACKFGQVVFPVPALQNAGRDTSLCSGNPWGLGSAVSKWFKYSWNRSDILDSFSIGNPRYNPVNSGTNPDTQLFVLVTNRGVCTTKDTVRLIVQPLPRLTIAQNRFELCEGSTIKLQPVATGGTVPYQWRWSPGKTLSDSVISAPVARPLSSVRYTVSVTDKNKCATSDTIRLEVYPNPVARFYWPVSCQNQAVVVSDSSLLKKGIISSRLWSTTGFDTFGLSVLNLNMNGKSKLPLTLTVISDKGCADTIARMVDVKASPKTNFIAPSVCDGDTTRFSNLSMIDSGSIVAWKWDFADGFGSSVKTPKYRYSGYADRMVQLVAISNFGCSDTFSKLVRVHPVPKSDFTFSNVCAGDSFTFISKSLLYGDTLKSLLWSFGKTDSIVKHIIPSWGSHPVSLAIETIHGCKASKQDSARVFPLPKPSFSVAAACLNLPQVFKSVSGIPQGTISNYRWNFGDGTTAATAAPVHTYLSSGNYTVTLLLTSDKGCKDSISAPVKVFPAAWPVFAVNNHCFGDSLRSLASVYGTGTPKLFKWFTGDGDSLAGASFRHIYKTPGTYQVRLSVRTDSGCVRDSMANVIVNPKPLVAFAVKNPCQDDSLVFTDQSTIITGSLGVAQWRFTGSADATGSPVKRTFAPAGNGFATLRHTSDKGCKDSLTQPYTAFDKVIVDYTVSDVCLEETSQFTNLSRSGVAPTAIQWEFGDGIKSPVSNPGYRYKIAGNYTTRLNFTTLPGCVYSGSRSTTVNPKPKPLFSNDPDQGTIVNPNITFTDQSTGADTVWYKFSTGFSTNLRNFTKALPDSGIFTITQYVSTMFGCKDSFSKQIVIQYMYTQHVPTAFTPDGNNLNDGFGPQGMGIKWYSMKIYSRWGEKIYETRESKPWTGLYQGQPVPEGVYVVLLEIKDYKGKNHYYKGSLQLLRGGN